MSATPLGGTQGLPPLSLTSPSVECGVALGPLARRGEELARSRRRGGALGGTRAGPAPCPMLFERRPLLFKQREDVLVQPDVVGVGRGEEAPGRVIPADLRAGAATGGGG